MDWLAVRLFFSRIPLWIYAAIAVAALVLWYGSGRYDAGVAHERAAQVKAQAIAVRAVLKQRDNAEAAERERLARIDKQLTKDQTNALAKRDRTIADLRSGAVRLRQKFTCPAQSGVLPQAAAGQPGDQSASGGGLSEQAAEFLIRFASDADKAVNTLTACQAALP